MNSGILGSLFAGTLLVATAGAGIESTGFARWPIRTGYTAELLARAQPDEYYYGMGSISNQYVAGGIDPAACYLRDGQPRPKVNEAYVWSMALAGRKLYFGTVANGNALAAAGSFVDSGMSMPPSESFSGTQEFGLSAYGQAHGVQPAVCGDWRPPSLYRYDLDTRNLERLSDSLPADAADNLRQLEGLRAGGSVPPTRLNPRGLVVLAGPRLNKAVGGVGFFFFDGTSGAFLGSIIRPEFSNIRRFAVLNGDLYAGVQLTNSDGHGAVIRIVNRTRDAQFPRALEIVGELDQAGADIAVHDGRLFVTTWPGFLNGGGVDMSNPLAFLQRAPGLWMSPPVPTTGLTTAHSRGWTKVWHANLYDPDMVMAATYGGGALCSFDGWLYFGTMHSGMTATMGYALLYGLPETTPPAGAMPGSPAFIDWLNNRSPGAVYSRATRMSSLFRMRAFVKPRMLAGIPVAPGGECQLLYGYHTVPVWNPLVGAWITPTNVMKQVPLMGPAGLGSASTYVWSMACYRNSLYLGTLGTLIGQKGMSIGTEAEFLAATANPLSKGGAALLMLPSSRAGAFVPISESGLGNPCNYGVRTLVPTDDALFVGTANAYNLMGNPNDTLPDGGWELLKLTHQPSPAMDVDGDYIADPAWSLRNGDALALGSAGPTTNLYAGVASSRTAWADYDGDGRTDPGWFTPATRRWRARLSTHGGALIDLATTPAIRSPAIPVPADFDGDGEADLAWCDLANGAITWQSLAAGAGARVTVKRGGKGGVPAVADYDGDGRADPAWYDQASGEWFIRFSATGMAGIERRAAIRGTPVPADYDGDGRADLAVCDATTGVIQVLDYSGGDAPFATPEAPGGAWLPLCGDYDGDGRADFAWYLPGSFTLRIRFADGSTGEWLVPEVGDAAATPVADAAARDYRELLDRRR